MRLLVHKNIKNTLIYTQLVTFEDDDYVCKATSNVKEASELIESGYEYVCEMDNLKLFKKRKQDFSKVYGFMPKSWGWELNPYITALQAVA